MQKKSVAYVSFLRLRLQCLLNRILWMIYLKNLKILAL